MRGLRYVLADVFTDTPLEGNQLAVFTDGRELDTELMQKIACEMNLSETVFVLPPEGEGQARIRIFTPSSELQFAGHPTLGAAFVLGGPLQSEALHLQTGAGLVTIELEREGPRISFGRMQQPLPTIEPFRDVEALLFALGAAQAALPVEIYDNGVPHVYVALGSREAVAELQPDLPAVERLVGARGTYCFAGEGARWKARMFGPGIGIQEDPATGSAAGPLALHLARHGVVAFGTEIEIEQGAEMNRPARMYATAFGSADAVERIEVGGSAVIVARGEFRLPG
jgi:trans-2,3-dihydro-3-hydroxyanthranilate isomerase